MLLTSALSEKEDDARARAAIKAQIELDKKARAERTAREKAIRDGGVVDVGTGASASVAKPAGAIGGAGKDYPETRLQVRLSLSSSYPIRLICPRTVQLTAAAALRSLMLVSGSTTRRRSSHHQDPPLIVDSPGRGRMARVRVARRDSRQRRHLNPVPEPNIQPRRVWAVVEGAGVDTERSKSVSLTGSPCTSSHSADQPAVFPFLRFLQVLFIA